MRTDLAEQAAPSAANLRTAMVCSLGSQVLESLISALPGNVSSMHTLRRTLDNNTISSDRSPAAHVLIIPQRVTLGSQL